jgi:hypothetical protein
MASGGRDCLSRTQLAKRLHKLHLLVQVGPRVVKLLCYCPTGHSGFCLECSSLMTMCVISNKGLVDETRPNSSLVSRM